MKSGDPVTVLQRVGPATARNLLRLGISCVGDLLLHLPMRYEDRTRYVPLREVEIGQSCLVTGELVKSGRIETWWGTRYEDDYGRSLYRLSDDGG